MNLWPIFLLTLRKTLVTRITQKMRMHIPGIPMAREMVSWSEEGVGGMVVDGACLHR